MLNVFVKAFCLWVHFRIGGHVDAEVIVVLAADQPDQIRRMAQLAGIAHAGPGIAEEAYDRVNRLATAELAAAAKAVGIHHLVFVSSIRAQSGPSATAPLRETDAPQPTDAYGRSKLAAEDAVRASGVPHTILRPVLIYGPGVKGNLARLIEIARTPWSLPFGLCHNRRSLLARQNLIEAIHFALQAEAAKNQTYIVADPVPPRSEEQPVRAKAPVFSRRAMAGSHRWRCSSLPRM